MAINQVEQDHAIEVPYRSTSVNVVWIEIILTTEIFGIMVIYWTKVGYLNNKFTFYKSKLSPTSHSTNPFYLINHYFSKYHLFLIHVFLLFFPDSLLFKNTWQALTFWSSSWLRVCHVRHGLWHLQTIKSNFMKNQMALQLSGAQPNFLAPVKPIAAPFLGCFTAMCFLASLLRNLLSSDHSKWKKRFHHFPITVFSIVMRIVNSRQYLAVYVCLGATRETPKRLFLKVPSTLLKK